MFAVKVKSVLIAALASVVCITGGIAFFGLATGTVETGKEEGAVDEKVSVIRESLVATVAALHSVHMTVAERGDFVQLGKDENIHANVVFKDLWCNGRKAQWRLVDGGENPGDDWWRGFGVPDQPPSESEPTDVPSHSDMFVPLLEVDRPWAPASRAGASPLANRLAQAPIERWTFLGEVELGGERAAKVEVEQSIPFDAGEDGQLNVAQVWIAWFLRDKGNALKRIESSMRYRLNGKTYRPTAGNSHQVYEASDFRRFGDVWYPYAGRQEMFESSVSVKNAFDWDGIADELVATDGENLNEPLQRLRLTAVKEWRVLHIGKYDTHQPLSLGAPDGATVVGSGTSRPKIPAIGEPSPSWQIAGWIDGKQRDQSQFRGKVVVLDFWGMWCGPCVQAVDAMQQLERKYDDREVVFVSIHTPGRSSKDIAAFKKEKGWTSLGAIDAGPSVGAGKTALSYGVTGYPTIVIVSADGSLAYHSGIEPPDAQQHAKYLGDIAKSEGLPWPLETDVEKNGKAHEQLTKLQVAWLSKEIDKVKSN